MLFWIYRYECPHCGEGSKRFIEVTMALSAADYFMSPLESETGYYDVLVSY